MEEEEKKEREKEGERRRRRRTAAVKSVCARKILSHCAIHLKLI